MRQPIVAIAASVAVFSLGLTFGVAAPARAQQFFGSGDSSVVVQPPASGQAPVSGPTSSNYGFPKPVVQPQASSWTNPLAGAATAMQNAFTPRPASPPRVDNLPIGDPTSLRTAMPTINAAVHLEAARLASKRGRVDEAKRQYEAVLSLEPKHVESLISLARIADLREGMNAAAKIYVVALNAHPKRAAIHNDFGMCAARHERLDISLSAFKEAVRLAPTKVLYRNNYAKALILANRNQESLEQLVAAHPPASAHYNFAFLLNENAAPAEQVIFHLRQALRLDPSLGNARTLFHQVASREQTLRETKAFNNRQGASVAAGTAQQQPVRGDSQQFDGRFVQPVVQPNTHRRYGQNGLATPQQPGPPQQPGSQQPPVQQLPVQQPRQPVAPGQAYQPAPYQQAGMSGPTAGARYTASRFPAVVGQQQPRGQEASIFPRSANRGPVYLPAAAPGRAWSATR